MRISAVEFGQWRNNTVKYLSTRGASERPGFDEVVLRGLAPDGGLYLPTEYPQFSEQGLQEFAGLSYPELAFRIIRPYVGDSLSDQELADILEQAYESFQHPAIAPVVQYGHRRYLLELFHGPTLAFKDFALQFLGLVFDRLLSQQKKRLVILGATSGDTGSAAIAGCRDCEYLDIFILHPHERVSAVQRRQMTTVDSPNVHNIAINGNFDDCQNLVKACFADQSFLQGVQLGAINSINWARIVAQVVYYFYAALAIGAPGRRVSFSVPTGNFGDIFAGYVAYRMGLPIDRLLIATNENDILHRCLHANDYRMQKLKHTLSPSMDILISSNFERLLFDLYDRDATEIGELMQSLNSHGAFSLAPEPLEQMRRLFASHSVSDAQVVETIRSHFRQCAYLLDPHSAIAVNAANATFSDAESAIISLCTAHPVKFSDAIERAEVDAALALPEHLRDLFEREEKYDVLDNDVSELQRYIAARITTP